MNLEACRDLPVVFETGTWYRAARLRHLPSVLRTTHTRVTPSRFNPGRFGIAQFEILYLADSHHVALHEVQALLGSPANPIPNPADAWIVVNARVRLQRIVDLTDETIAHSRLGTSAQELTGDWRGYQWRHDLTPVQKPTGVAPTQLLGAALYAHQPALEGFVSISARVPYQRILCVFPDRLSAGSSVRFEYLDAGGIQRLHELP